MLAPLQKLPKNVEYLGKLIVAKGFKKLPKVQKIAQSGHTGYGPRGPRFNISHQQVLLNIYPCLEQTKIEKKRQRIELKSDVGTSHILVL